MSLHKVTAHLVFLLGRPVSYTRVKMKFLKNLSEFNFEMEIQQSVVAFFPPPFNFLLFMCIAVSGQPGVICS